MNIYNYSDNCFYRLFEEMKNFFHFDLQIPSSDSVLIHDLGRWLRMAGSITKVLVVFDAVNQLDDGSGVSGKFVVTF